MNNSIHFSSPILAKLAVFYAIFYFFLGCFFVALVYVFASILDRREPRYYNTESRMAVRSPTAVGLYFFSCLRISFISLQSSWNGLSTSTIY